MKHINNIFIAHVKKSEIRIMKNDKLPMMCLVLEYFELGSRCYREQEF